MLEELAYKIPSWKSLARRLGTEESRIAAFDRDSEELAEKAYRMLLHWKQRYGPEASFQVLYNALSHVLVNRRDLAERFCLFDASAEASDSTVPPEVRVQGREAVLAFQNAMRSGRVKVHRGRIMFIGQERAGKTSLKKSLIGIPFDPRQDSTVGIEVDPSKFEVEVNQVKNWQRTEQKKLDVSEFSENIAKMIAKDLSAAAAFQDSLEEQVKVMMN